MKNYRKSQIIWNGSSKQKIYVPENNQKTENENIWINVRISKLK